MDIEEMIEQARAGVQQVTTRAITTDERYADAAEQAARRACLALGICPEHGSDMQVVAGDWRCPKCESDEFFNQEQGR